MSNLIGGGGKTLEDKKKGKEDKYGWGEKFIQNFENQTLEYKKILNKK